MKTLLVSLALLAAAPALAQTQAPDLKTPDTLTDIWGPLKPLPLELRPEIAWDKLLAGYQKRKQVQKNERDKPVVSETTRRYDAAGRVVRIDQAETRLDFSYDDKGRITRRVETYAGSGSINAYVLMHTYTYDAAGHLTHVTKEGGGAPGKTEMIFSYDAAGLLVRRADDGVGKAGWGIVRSKTGVVIGLTSGAYDKPEVLQDGTADDKGRLAKVKSGRGPGAQEDSFSYDAAGREVMRVTTTADATDTVKLTYDPAGRLVKIEGEKKGNNGSVTMLREATYDAAGRMTRSGSSGHRSEGRIQSSDVREIVFTYDAAGRLVGEKEKAGGGDGQHGYNLDAETSYRYDAAGRLVEVTSHAAGYPPLDRTATTTYSY